MNAIIKEACRHGEVLSACLDQYFEKDNETLSQIKKVFKEKGLERILFAGVGSSYYAPYCVSGYLSRKGIPASVFNAFDLSRNNFQQITDKTLLVCISQSGRTGEVVELAKKAKGIAAIVGIYNKQGSPLSEIADYSLLIYSGEETVISNKSYICMQAVLNILAHSLAGEYDEAFKAECRKANVWIADWLKHYEKNAKLLLKLTKDAVMYDFFADGESVSTINQAALIMREAPKVYTAAKECSDYAHGWYRCVKPGYLGFCFAPEYKQESTDKRMVDNVLEHGGKAILFTGSKVEAENGLAVVSLPKVRKTLFPLMEIIPCAILMGMITSTL